MNERLIQTFLTKEDVELLTGESRISCYAVIGKNCEGPFFVGAFSHLSAARLVFVNHLRRLIAEGTIDAPESMDLAWRKGFYADGEFEIAIVSDDKPQE